MNTNTGELVRITREQTELLMPNGFTPVPEEHQAEANAILGDNNSAFADMTADTPLVKWAKSHQKRNKNRAKMAKASRRKNRR